MKDLFSRIEPGKVGVKICGITHAADAAMALAEGADALGFNFYPGSKRFLELEKERAWLQDVPETALRVAVVVNPTFDEAQALAGETFLDALQLHGEETPEFCQALQEATGKIVIKALRVQSAKSLLGLERFGELPLLLDAFQAAERGGTGQTFDWNWLTSAMPQRQRIILSGGLTPENIQTALRLTGVAYVDVASGVEEHARKKSLAKTRGLISKVRDFSSEFGKISLF